MSFTHVSASSIKLFESCPKRWFHKYVLGFKEEGSAAMELGSKVHTCLEGYLAGGPLEGDPAIVEIAEQGVHLLPPAGENLKIEMSLDDYPLPDLPIPFKGFIDCLILPTREGDLLEVLDHKTTSAFKYAKTAADLAEDTQMIVYAKHVLFHFPAEREIRLSHIAYLTKEPLAPARKTSVVVSRSDVDAAFSKIMETVGAMLESCQLPVGEQQKNLKYCYSYGKRCPFYSDCYTNPLNMTEEQEKMSEKQMSVIARLRKSNKKSSVADSACASEPVPAAATNEAATNEKEAVAAETTTTSSILYVDCMPVQGQQVAQLQVVLAQHINEIVAAKRAMSLELIPYSEGYALLNAKLATLTRVEGLAYVNSGSNLYVKCGHLLSSLFDVVVIRT